jgi:predicted GNAT superfamily acetyltransferase
MGELAWFYGGEHTEPLEDQVALIKAALSGPDPAARVLIARDGEKAAGFASYTFLWPAVGFTRSLYLKELFLAEAYRRAGVGRRFMEELHAIARREGCSRVEWTTDVPNAAARRFYASLGFAENGSKIFYRSTL